MLDFPTISQNAPRFKSQDYALLREQGIIELQAMAGNIWTDYNLHDPGITLLEALLYAITDLGYRLDHSIPVLLASHPDGRIALDDHFHRAKEILPNCPYTPQDYWKYFLDIPGLRNVLLERAVDLCPILYCRTEEKKGGTPSCESPFYSLSFNRDQTVADWEVTDWQKQHPNGLYCISLILEPEVEWDLPNPPPVIDLGGGRAISQIQVSGQSFQVITYLPHWQDLNLAILGDPDNQIESIELVREPEPATAGTRTVYAAEVAIQFSAGKEVVRFPVTMQVRAEVPLRTPRPVPGRIVARSAPPLRLEKAASTGRSLRAVLINVLTAVRPNGLFPVFQRSVIRASEVIRQVKGTYCAKRNLCEDIERVKLCRPQEVVVKAAIELETSADPERTVAQLLCEIDQYLSPAVRFHTLDELLAEEMPVEEIFEGPLLRHGFIKDEEAVRLKRRTAVYNSDLIRIMACTSGVLAIRELLTCSFIGLEEVVTDEANCFQLAGKGCYYFRLDPDRCLDDDNLCCFQGGVLVTLDQSLVKAHYRKIKAQLPGRIPQDDGLSLPKGKVMDLGHWPSVQSDLPRLYGIGAAGLPTTATAFQQGRARQLKGYLMFFEQMMANYLSQLSHIGSLFSMEADVFRTYFFQDLYELPKIGPLFKAQVDSGQSWEDFLADHQNDYIQALEKATENLPRFLERRNRFLDHLLARVGEDVLHYENWVRNYYRGDPEFILQELIRVKQRLMAFYPGFSSPRATALHYCKKRKDGSPDVWDTDNISGYLQRVCAKVGLYNCRRRNLCHESVFPDVFEIFDETDTDGITEWWFRLRDEDGTILMTASDRYTVYNDLINALKTVAQLGMYRDNYLIKISNAGRYYFVLRDGTDTLARRIPGFPTLEKAEATIARIMEMLWERFNGEGIHLVEHILLRPRTRNYTLLQPFLCDAEQRRKVRMIKDPYSFVMTLVLPSSYERDFSDTTSPAQPTECSPRLRDLAYRQVVETVIREEAPAHIFLRVFWLDRDTSGSDDPAFLSLNRFEKLYREWLEDLDQDSAVLQPSNDALVEFLNQLLPVPRRPA
ncbi:hypothetical protein [Flavilitoribacter nigricans]|uniref:Uncharacterized protein n=1 Tax=Flavilitoribacter nigricans (strain ATCC 23147 / DSM 23189 / NBRC 102662 / NCIMB 1420 / SS-2) TaxID=1122177 RepID=A0A2D0MYQ5_FLAN2|nr:hypothetical protein [Flavilitoribacter nigricans]PHN01256.1 hypothetical protein CRP01_37900 [Flavilitoribacter nigricans DSM 23189 = NBRC 102662]